MVGSKGWLRASLRNKHRTWHQRLQRFLLAVFLLVVMLPTGLLLFYRIEGVHPVSTLMVRDYVMGVGVTRQWRPLDDISPWLRQSVIMSEDGQFCSHHGVDWGAVNEVVRNAIDGERPRGASTITMQLVKNLFLWPDRSLVRKALEVPYALLADAILPKHRILEIYLNIVEWDRGVFGAQAAAQAYFGRSAKSFSRRQAAMMAVTLPNPLARNPAKPTGAMGRVARIVERRARNAGPFLGCL